MASNNESSNLNSTATTNHDPYVKPSHPLPTSSLTDHFYSMKNQFSQLSNEKQFAFISLVALGTSMLITGRSVRAIMKRVNTKPSENPEPEMMMKKMKKTNVRDELIGKVSINNNVDKHRFWDNKSLLCVKDREEDQDVELNFNPASDALGAFTIATLIVIGASAWTIKSLSNRWELDNFEDWRIFIQSGYLGKHVIPNNLPQSISQSIPNKLRTSQSNLSDHQSQSSQLNSSSYTPDPTTTAHSDSQLQDFIQTFDREWQIERERREVERIEWENQRKTIGKKVWSE